MLTVDAHIDVPWKFTKHGTYSLAKVAPAHGDVDFPRMFIGGLNTAFFALYLPDSWIERTGKVEAFKKILWQIDQIDDLVGSQIVDSSLQAEKVAKTGQVPIFLGLEGTSVITALKDYSILRSLGVRYVTLCHNKTNEWFNSATDLPAHKTGVAVYAKAIVRHCNNLDIKIDVSHVHDTTIEAILGMTNQPIMATHSNARKMFDHARNLPDYLIKQIVEKGGIVCVNFAKKFLGETTPAQHIDHIIQLTGTVGGVGVGSDLDGAAMMPTCPNAARWLPSFASELHDMGYTHQNISDIAGGNLMRFFV